MRDRPPSESLQLLNEALLRQRSDRRFCTVAHASLDPRPGEVPLAVASGGHPLPIVLRADGSVDRVGHHGTLLGVVPDPDLPDASSRLAPGDALVLYTDGVTDIRSTTVDPSPEWLEELVRSCAGMTADGIAGRIERAAIDAQDGENRDDIAVVVLRASDGP